MDLTPLYASVLAAVTVYAIIRLSLALPWRIKRLRLALTLGIAPHQLSKAVVDAAPSPSALTLPERDRLRRLASV